MPADDKPNLSSNLSSHPTLLQRLGLDYYYKPSNPIAEYIWRWQVWVGATFTLGMLEPIEVLSLVIVFSLLTALFYLSLYKYFPAHFAFLRRRVAYYLYGDETIPVFTLDSESVLSRWRFLVSWFKHVLGHKRGSAGESLNEAVRGISQTISETASKALASTASAVGETAKAEL